MIRFFFPSSAFGWSFAVVLLGFLAAASWTDLRRMIVPKWITLTTLAVGVVANMIRGAWLGGVGLSTWILPAGGGFGVGLLDGLLFALAGTVVAFAVMFALWILGVCGGGDVKLYAAVGAWVGPWNIFPVLIVAGVCLAFVGFVGLVGKVMGGRVPQSSPSQRPPKSRLVAFSWPLAIGTLLVLAFLLGNDLQTVRNLHTPNPVQTDAR